MNIQLPQWSEKLFKPARYKITHGGRGGGKSHTIARVLLTIAMSKPIRVLCAREFQNSIAESVHRLLSSIIFEYGLPNFRIHNDRIEHLNGSQFIFKGVRRNVDSIKSMTGITHLWLEEAHTVSKQSWDVLIPTIREENSEIWVSFNPDLETDPTYIKFIKNNPPPDSTIIKVNWQDNPWFPETLRQEKDYLWSVNPELALHVWEGHCRTNSDAQILKGKWRVDTLQPMPREKNWHGPYFGADWGFSVDPTAGVKCWLINGSKGGFKLYIEKEVGGVGIELNELSDMFLKLDPEIKKHKIKADNARPETISHVKNQGFIIEAAPKWAGSVEDGITWLRSLEEIIINPNCSKTIDEAKNYSYKKDRLTNEVTTQVVDAYNHYIDSIRYALSSHIQKSKNNQGKFTNEMTESNIDNYNTDTMEW